MYRNPSLWHRTVSLAPRPMMEKDISTSVAIIGAGMAGILTAYQLAQHGIKSVVLEAKRIACGQTGNTTAKITSQHGMIYDALIKKFGTEKAQQYGYANQLALESYGEIIRDKNIFCDFHELPAYLYSTINAEPLKTEASAAAALGLPASFVTDTGLPFPNVGAVRFDRQAQFNPLKFIEAISSDLEIYENTTVMSVEDDRLETNRGTVRADHIVFASHFPFVNVPGWYFMRMHQERSYVVALESSWLPNGMYISDDSGSLSLREANGLLLLGGGNHRTGENSSGGRFDDLLLRGQKLFPGCREAARWSAQDCITLDGVPYIGQFAPTVPNHYVATGFAKWGMTSSMVSAIIISSLIRGHEPEWSEIFSPLRFDLSASAASLATETAQSFKGLAREFLTLPQNTLDELPLGRGGIVDVDGRKAGVYKDENGKCHVVEAKCPHLGCQLEWNPDEKSWDCPCHGSRFSFDGKLLDNPAQTSLK